MMKLKFYCEEKSLLSSNFSFKHRKAELLDLKKNFQMDKNP